jgi:hypothetical protein
MSSIGDMFIAIAIILIMLIFIIEIIGGHYLLPHIPKKYWCLYLWCPVLMLWKLHKLFIIETDISVTHTNKIVPFGSVVIINNEGKCLTASEYQEEETSEDV